MDLLQVIIDNEQNKKELNIFPTHVTFIQLMNITGLSKKELGKKLNKLFKDKKIQVGRTINDKWIKYV